MNNTLNLKEDILESLRDTAQKNEEKILHSKAALSKNHKRFEVQESDHRLPYKRDVDRIVHSKAYSRYTDKTQVVYLVENDHITHRSLHVQLVSNFARGIAEILGLNLDLVEAISLGHDVGHCPFGHEGENYLSAITQKYKLGSFTHPHQSCRLLSEIEPLNLGFAVYDGFLCHDGGMATNRIEPLWNKNWEGHFAERQKKTVDPDINLIPATLEGALVKLCDTMSYVGRDIEDAISIGIITRNQVPETILGTTNREILHNLATDIIKNSYGKDYIEVSKESFNALQELRSFNFKSIYNHPKLKVESTKIERSYQILFEYLFSDLKANNTQSFIWENFLHNKAEAYLKNTSEAQKVTDYIAGMTDHYFVRTLNRLIIPTQIKL